jgi:hypothetical protein
MSLRQSERRNVSYRESITRNDGELVSTARKLLTFRGKLYASVGVGKGGWAGRMF